MNTDTTREQILQGFTDQLLDVGYRGISLQSITDAVGIKRPSLYHHFPDGKEQIYTEVALRMIDDDAARVAAALADHRDLKGRLVALALLHTDDARKAALDQRIYDATRYVGDETRTLVSTRYVEGLLSPVTDMMRQAVSRGELRPIEPDLLMQTFFGMTGAVQDIPEDVGMPPDRRGSRSPALDMAEKVVDLFLRGAGAG
jgi:AcrR family transcriptional regulator